MAIMGFLFSKPKIQGDERNECLAYLEDEWKLKAFQGRESDIYNNTAAPNYKSPATDTQPANEMLKAASRLRQSADELIRRRSEMAFMPDAASAMYSAWSLAYAHYLVLARALWVAIASSTAGVIPQSQRIQELSSQFEKYKKKAIDEERKLVRRLGLSSSDILELFGNASTTVVDEDWQPEV